MTIDADDEKEELTELVKLFGLYDRTMPESVDDVVTDILAEVNSDAM